MAERRWAAASGAEGHDRHERPAAPSVGGCGAAPAAHGVELHAHRGHTEAQRALRTGATRPASSAARRPSALAAIHRAAAGDKAHGRLSQSGCGH